MTRYRIASKPDHLEVELDETRGRQTELLEAFQACRDGRCTCPTQEYEKLDALEIDQSEDRIGLRLTPKPGQKLDQSEIARCLDHTVKRVSKDG